MIQGATVIYKVADGCRSMLHRTFDAFRGPWLAQTPLVDPDLRWHWVQRDAHALDPERVHDRRLGESRHGVRLRISVKVERGVPGDEFAGCKRIAQGLVHDRRRADGLVECRRFM